MITDGVVPSLHVDYKHTKIKQYHKQGRALRTETTINNPHDFRVSKRLTSLPDLRQLGFTANRRLLGVQTISHDPIRGAKAFTDLTTPLVTGQGTRIPGDTRVHALLRALLMHRLLPHGFTNRELRALTAPLLGKRFEDITAARSPTTCGACAPTGSSNASPAAADTVSPTPGCSTRCCSPTPTTTCSEPASLQPSSTTQPTALRKAARAYQIAFNDLTPSSRTRRLNRTRPKQPT